MTTYRFPIPKLRHNDRPVNIVVTGPATVIVCRDDRISTVWTPLGCTISWLIEQDGYEMISGSIDTPSVVMWTTPLESAFMVATKLTGEFDRIRRAEMDSMYGLRQTAWLAWNEDRLLKFKRMLSKIGHSQDTVEVLNG